MERPLDETAFEPLGETCLLVRLGDRIDAAVNARVHALAHAVEASALPGIVEIVPAYASLAVHYEPLQWIGEDGAPWSRLVNALRALVDVRATAAGEPRVLEIPVRYGGEVGVDLAEVAAYAGLAPEEVVRRHAAARYRVAMIGFAPGFPYLLGLDPALAMPRRAQPRLRVPAQAPFRVRRPMRRPSHQAFVPNA